MSTREDGDLGYNGFSVSLFYLSVIDSDRVPDPNVQITLKNLTRKNSVTKEKRLEEFLRMLKDSTFDVLDYTTLVCWIQTYPRLAVDSSKAIRGLSHQILSMYTEKFGPKDFSKYLKSTLPVWLQGLYDDKSIAMSVRKDLLKCFSNDADKVDHKIWVIFHQQIINYCYTVLIHESATTISDEKSENPEELAAKYDRASNAAIQMVLHIIRLVNNCKITLTGDALSQVYEILSSEKFWGNIGSCVSLESFNAALFKSYLSLISELFSLSDEGKLSTFTSELKDVKLIYKLVSKRLLKHVKLSTSSSVSSNIIYSSIVIPLWSTLTVLTTFSTPSAGHSLKIKRNFWHYGSSKSYSRLKDYLKLGPCSSDPTYYLHLKIFFTALKRAKVKSDDDFAFLEFSSFKDAKTILQKILIPQVYNAKGFDSFSYRAKGIECLLSVFKLFAEDLQQVSEIQALSLIIFLDALDIVSCSVIRERDLKQKETCIAMLAQFSSEMMLDLSTIGDALLDFLDNGTNDELFGTKLNGSSSRVCENFYLIAESVATKKGEMFLQSLIHKIDELHDLDKLNQLFTIILDVLTPNSNLLMEWAEMSLASFITDEFVDLPIKILDKLLRINANVDFMQLFDDFQTKLVAESDANHLEFLNVVSRYDKLDLRNLANSLPESYSYLLALSQNKDRSDFENELLLRFIQNPEILNSTLESTLGTNRERVVIAKLVKSGESVELPAPESKAMRNLISKAILSLGESDSQEFLCLIKKRDELRAVVFDNMIQLPIDYDYTQLAQFIVKEQDLFPLEEIYNMVKAAINAMDISSLTLANPLNQNIYLISRASSTQLNDRIFSVGSFLNEYVSVSQSEEPRILILLGICAEYLKDYTFLATAEETPKLSEVYETLSNSFFARIQTEELSIPECFNGQSRDKFISVLLEGISGKGPYSAYQFYIARIIVVLMSPKFEEMSLSNFDALDINYTRIVHQPLKLAALLSSVTKFIGVSSKLDRIKNYVFGELLGVTTTKDFLESGFTWLSLASNFLSIESHSQLLPNHKLCLLINQFGIWLESDIAFNDDFTDMRALLALFLSLFISLVKDGVPDKTWQIAVDLCLNNFGFAQIKPDQFALAYFSMKLFAALDKFVDTTVYSEWRESRKSLEEELIDLMLAKLPKGQEYLEYSRVADFVNEGFERHLGQVQVSKQYLNENSDKLYDILTSSKSVAKQRMATLLLQRHIFEFQQDAILESQFKNSKLSDELGNSEAFTKLSPFLLEVTCEDNRDALDYHFRNEDYPAIFSFLWSWKLIFDYFRDSTLSMRTKYNNQLREAGSIDLLFDIISEHVPFSNSDFLKTLVNDTVEKGEKVDPQNSLVLSYDLHNKGNCNFIRDEAYLLLAHIFFLSFQFMGSSVQQWFNGVRDLQLKSQIEKFSTRYISPILISKMLADVDSAKDKLTINDDTLSIKVNKVTNEIKSIYLIDEQVMEMVVKIPEIYPLANVTVEGPVRLGVKENQWRAWLLASQRVVTLTNGSIIDCIELFNKNVSLHFSGFDDCAICYSILHQDNSLPSKVCPTCQNKFHAACLYKWFKSSGSSTCPLCRSTFNFKIGRA